MLTTSKMEYYSNLIEDNQHDQKVLFSTVGKLLHRKADRLLPGHTSLVELSNRFADFFTTKITCIKENLNVKCVNAINPFMDSHPCPTEFNKFVPITELDLSKLVGNSSSKSCSLDPLPASLLKNCFDILLPVITRIINLSLSQGVVPSQLKRAAVTPIIKKPSLDSEILQNYRPISNLTFISKSKGCCIST